MNRRASRSVKSEINRRAHVLAQEWYSECVQRMVNLYEQEQLLVVEIDKWRPQEMVMKKKQF